MHIDSKEKILETPILEVRKLLRKGHSDVWYIRLVTDTLKISEGEALVLVEELVKQGFVQPVKRDDEKRRWENTLKGNTLALASAAKQITRKTADKNFAQFMERVEKVNTDPYFLYKVKKVILFGSYLTDAPKISDIDLAVELVPKENDEHLRKELFEERIYEALDSGKRFTSILERYAWPEIEVRKFLKSRSRVISLHSAFDNVLKTTDCKIVYSESE